MSRFKSYRMFLEYVEQSTLVKPTSEEKLKMLFSTFRKKYGASNVFVIKIQDQIYLKVMQPSTIDEIQKIVSSIDSQAEVSPYKPFNENYFVANDYVYVEPTLPYGWQAAQMSYNGREIGRMPAQDTDLTRGALDTYGRNKHSYVNFMSALMGDYKSSVIEIEPLDEVRIDSLEILRMYESASGVGMDIYIRFYLNDHEHWGVFKRYGDMSNSRFYCDSLQMLEADKGFQVKLVGSLKRELDEWFKPKPGAYQILKENFVVYDGFGRQREIPKNAKVNIVSTPDILESTATMVYDNHSYKLTIPRYYWWNYWTKSLDSQDSE